MSVSPLPGDPREPTDENGETLNYMEQAIEEMNNPPASHRHRKLKGWWSRHGFLWDLEDKSLALKYVIGAQLGGTRPDVGTCQCKSLWLDHAVQGTVK